MIDRYAYTRRATHPVMVGSVQVGGGAPVVLLGGGGEGVSAAGVGGGYGLGAVDGAGVGV